ncbi:c-type cytochrome [Sphingobium sp. LMC3-1-1.1]|uniref:c-type cytochrome n=1 Tax=Sphingobium sp. LMC3-1-1.1 TaxID=3135241 RepID=UPI003434917D
MQLSLPRRAMDLVKSNAAGLALAFASAVALSTVSAQAAPADGEALFKGRCQMCHTHKVDGKNGVGPALYGIAKRPAASVPAFNYSAALKNSKLVWTEAVLDKFLLAPSKMVPGTRMVTAVPSATERKAVIAYLLSAK